MKLLAESHLATGWFTTRVRKNYDLTVVVKGTFRLMPGERARLLGPDEQLPISGDEHRDGDPEASLRYASDCEPLKEHADLLLVGDCHAPGGRPVLRCPVTFRVGAVERNLTVHGDRVWNRSLVGSWTAGEPQPFASMPLVWECAFGGSEYAVNPVGCGAGADSTKLPNVEDPRDAVQAPDRPYVPAGFAPLDRRWALRAGKTGTYDDRWLKEDWPGVPQDFDWSHYNAAPPPMQVKDFLRGDEPVFLRNLHPEYPEFSSALPGLKPRALLKAWHTSGPKMHELPLNLDTLWIDANTEILVLVWRGITPVRVPELDGIEALYVPVDYLDAPPLAPAQYGDRVEEMLAAPDSPQAPEPEAAFEAFEGEADAEASDAPEIEPPDPELAATLAEHDKKASAESRAKAEQNLPPEALAAMDAGDMDTFASVVLAKIGKTRADADKIVSDELDKVRALASAQGLDPRLVSTFGQEDDAPESDVPPGTPLTREQVEQRLLAGESLAGSVLLDLDLRALNFHGADLTNAKLTRCELADCDLGKASLHGATLVDCHLERAKIGSADLGGARLHEIALSAAALGAALLDDALLSQCDLGAADLRRASLSGAVFRECGFERTRFDDADLSGAHLGAADLSKCALTRATLNAANLESANLAGCRAAGASFRGALLSGASLESGQFEAADFSGARLEGVTFDNAKLAQATLTGASGQGVSMQGAAIDGLRAGGGCELPGLRATGARGAVPVWSDATLPGADFRYAKMGGALFIGADLNGSDLSAAVLRGANLSMANLQEAKLRAADLFGASFERADLSRTDLAGSSCFRAEFLDATLDHTVVRHANLKGTKLEQMRRGN